MAVTVAKPAVGTYTINTGATYYPDILYTMHETELVSSRLQNKGSLGTSGTYDGIFYDVAAGVVSAADTAGPTWSTVTIDSTSCEALSFSGDGSSTGDMIVLNSMCGITSSVTMYAIVETSGTAVNNAIMGYGDGTNTAEYSLAYIGSNENLFVNDNTEATSTLVPADTGQAISTSTVRLVAFKAKSGLIAGSVDGANWTNYDIAGAGGTNTTPGSAFTRIVLGMTGDSSPSSGATLKILAFALFVDTEHDNTQVAAVFNSGDPWTALGMGGGATKYLKLSTAPGTGADEKIYMTWAPAE